MLSHEYEIGIIKEALETPALLIDLPAMERNLKVMADFLADAPAKLRPHTKLHKGTPILAQMQLRAGNAVGVTCAKLVEAEVMASAGIRDILIANQIVGQPKIRRLVNLASYSDVMVAVDDAENVRQLSRAAQEKGVTLRVLVEVNIGNDRCGVPPLGPALELARHVARSPGLRFMGIMGYDGHCTMKADPEKREEMSRQANQLLVDTRQYLERAGLEVQIVSASGTFTYRYAATMPGITEIQAGTYILMDTAFKEHGVCDFELALSVLGTVISRPPWHGAEDLAIIDIGRKAMDLTYGLPTTKHPQGATVTSMPQEHARLHLEGEARKLKPGDKVELWVRDANGTINLFDRFHAIRDGVVEAVWEIPAAGRAT